MMPLQLVLYLPKTFRHTSTFAAMQGHTSLILLTLVATSVEAARVKTRSGLDDAHVSVDPKVLSVTSLAEAASNKSTAPSAGCSIAQAALEAACAVNGKHSDC